MHVYVTLIRVAVFQFVHDVLSTERYFVLHYSSTTFRLPFEFQFPKHGVGKCSFLVLQPTHPPASGLMHWCYGKRCRKNLPLPICIWKANAERGAPVSHSYAVGVVRDAWGCGRCPAGTILQDFPILFPFGFRVGGFMVRGLGSSGKPRPVLCRQVTMFRNAYMI